MNDPASLAAQAARYPWFHSIDLGHGVVTAGGKSPAVHAAEARAFFDRVDLAGRSVIDVGAWNGFYSFEAKRRGAARVLATDHFVWVSDQFRGRETFEFARKCLNADVEALEIDVPALSPERVGTFDVVLFLGVFYHLYDPIDGLGRAARLAKELLIVETALDLQDVPKPAMVFYPGAELAEDVTNWWGPNVLCMVDLLRGLGFTTIDATSHPMGRGRGIFHAWRSTRARRGDPAPESVFDVASMKSPSRRRKLRLGWRLIRQAIRGQ
jgi:tRNA (mo5U34)-methyltransferase